MIDATLEDRLDWTIQDNVAKAIHIADLEKQLAEKDKEIEKWKGAALSHSDDVLMLQKEIKRMRPVVEVACKYIHGYMYWDGLRMTVRHYEQSTKTDGVTET